MTADLDHRWTNAELADLAQRLTYKPGYVLRLQAHDQMPVIRLVVLATVPDSRSSNGSRFHLVFEHTLYQQCSRDRLLDQIRRATHVLETHEADEWLRLDGELVSDPHKEGQKR